MRKLSLTLLAAAALFAGLPALARATFTFTLSQVGNDVTITGAGTLNTTGLTLGGAASGKANLLPGPAALLNGPAATTNLVYYTGMTGPASFGSVVRTNASAGSGDLVGLQGNNSSLYVPANYVSGSALSDTSTYSNATFASLGFTPGTYTYVLPNDTLIVTGFVPEPSTWALLGLGTGLLGLVTLRRRRCLRRLKAPADPGHFANLN